MRFFRPKHVPNHATSRAAVIRPTMRAKSLTIGVKSTKLLLANGNLFGVDEKGRRRHLNLTRSKATRLKAPRFQLVWVLKIRWLRLGTFYQPSRPLEARFRPYSSPVWSVDSVEFRSRSHHEVASRRLTLAGRNEQRGIKYQRIRDVQNLGLFLIFHSCFRKCNEEFRLQDIHTLFLCPLPTAMRCSLAGFP